MKKFNKCIHLYIKFSVFLIKNLCKICILKLIVFDRCILSFFHYNSNKIFDKAITKELEKHLHNKTLPCLNISLF